MGIPSFYKHLIQSIGGLTSKVRASRPSVFALDLNCAIYHCVKKVQKATPYREEIHAAWELSLIQHVIAYIKQLVRNVDPLHTVYIAVDGVAPVAKIKQQRMRRFKSAVAAEQEARIKAEARGEMYVASPRWDTNAITPGTQFMAKLASALKEYAKTEPSKIHASAADEAGEGEHKIMIFARASKPKDMVIYGLDADLIVLALWAGATSTTQVDLYREETEFNGTVKTDASDEEQYLYMNMTHLASSLYDAYGRPTQSKTSFICDFVGLMNLLGNDFVPHGMALKIRDDGVQQLLEIQRTLDTPLVEKNPDSDEWQYNLIALRTVFTRLSTTESTSILRNVKKKLEARVGSTAGKTAEERAFALYNDTPVTWAAESVLVNRVNLQGYEYPQVTLKPNWTEIYDTHALWGSDQEKAAEYYIESLTWTLGYYSGQDVDRLWFYPWPLPPRHSSILDALNKLTTLPSSYKTPQIFIEPKEQLAMVLPSSSFHLLPSEYKKLLSLYPMYWPTAWGTYSFGRRFMWECEPLIPLISPFEIKQMIEVALDN
jgi:5'-3' exoribonuclease 1